MRTGPLINYLYLEYLSLHVVGWRGVNKKISPYAIFNLQHLIIYTQTYTSNKKLEKRFFISNRKLKRVVIFYSDLETIEAGCLDGLDLDALDLEDNNLKSLPENIFMFQINLQYLSLYNNDLTKLDAKEFKNLKKLEYLPLGGNKGTVSAEKSDERNAGACTCPNWWDCELPSFLKNDDDRAPSCFLE